MDRTPNFTVSVGSDEIVIVPKNVLYVMMDRNIAEIHIYGGEVYRVRETLADLEKLLGDNFVKASRSCIISVAAICSIDKKGINLINGETLKYVVRKKKELIAQIHEVQKSIISGFADESTPKTEEEYHEYYRLFDELPFAFADIEMVFNEKLSAVDWIFRYGNSALAELEKTPLGQLIGSSFGSIFSNMNTKWLRNYERTILFGQTLHMMDYSPEIDRYLKVICFPTFKGHCGCILFDISELNFAIPSEDTPKAIMNYLGRMFGTNSI